MQDPRELIVETHALLERTQALLQKYNMYFSQVQSDQDFPMQALVQAKYEPPVLPTPPLVQDDDDDDDDDDSSSVEDMRVAMKQPRSGGSPGVPSKRPCVSDLDKQVVELRLHHVPHVYNGARAGTTSSHDIFACILAKKIDGNDYPASLIKNLCDDYNLTPEEAKKRYDALPARYPLVADPDLKIRGTFDPNRIGFLAVPNKAGVLVLRRIDINEYKKNPKRFAAEINTPDPVLDTFVSAWNEKASGNRQISAGAHFHDSYGAEILTDCTCGV